MSIDTIVDLIHPAMTRSQRITRYRHLRAEIEDRVLYSGTISWESGVKLISFIDEQLKLEGAVTQR